MKNSYQYDIKFFEFIKNNLNNDPNILRLKYNGKDTGFNTGLAIDQIECRQKTKNKLSYFIKDERFLFPSVQAAEQSTNQCVASYHAMLIGKDKKIADLTAGLGIDSFTMALHGNIVTSFEIDMDRFCCLNHNKSLFYSEIKAENGEIEFIHSNSIEWLKEHSLNTGYDYIFIDPARRNVMNNRVFKFSDCKPNVVENFSLLQDSAENIIIKSSPILDIHQIIYEIPKTTSIHIVCVKGECKEVLVICSKDRSNDNPEIITVNLDNNENRDIHILSRWACHFNDLGISGKLIDYENIRENAYVYDPNAAIHKLRVDGKLCVDFPELYRLSANTDLYYSESLYKDFPGRIFKITSILTKKDLKGYNKQKREIITRNYPLTADQLRRKLSTLSGGNQYIIGAKVGENEKPLLLDCNIWCDIC